MPMFDPNSLGVKPRGWQILRLFGIPVYVEPAFLFLLGLIIFLYGYGDGFANPASLGLLCFIVFFSLLTHEFGHAIVSRLVGCDGIRISLVGFGGYATHTPTTRGRSLAIVLAGPLFGYLLALFALGLIFGGEHLLELGPSAVVDRLVHHTPEGAADFLLRNLFYLNLFWSTFNLLPIHPMDGGQSLFHALTYWLDPNRSMLWVCRLSMFLCIPLGILALALQFHFAAFFFVMFFMDNLRVSQALS